MLTVSSATPISTRVEKYVRAHLPAVGRIVEFEPPQGPGLFSVADGWHAFRFAERIRHEALRLEAESDGEGKFHLFCSSPNAMLFFLGSLWRGPGEIQLYEHELQGLKRSTYAPSLAFPLAPSDSA